MKNKKIFIDSNVWFSAFYKKGVCSNLIKAIHQLNFEIVICELVLEEILKNIKQKIPDALPLVIEYLKIIKPTVVKNPKKEVALKYKNLASLKDIPILISAFEYRCQYFITGNIKDFKVKLIEKELNLKIIKPAEFLRILEKKN
jgi:predicted nucleic acid-binding protein